MGSIWSAHSSSQIENYTSLVNSSTEENSFHKGTFSQVMRKPAVLLIFLFVLMLTLLALMGNALVCWTVYSTRRLRFGGYYFVASLAIADFLVGVFVLPMTLAYHVTSAMNGK